MTDLNGINARPRYRDVYRHRRVLRVHFYTSNADKLIQARILFGKFGHKLHFYRGRGDPYEETYEGTTFDLLRRAVHQISTEFGLRSIFFIEDTSLRIETLSGETDFPGMRVKEWFSEITFSELDKILIARGDDRRACIKSDIALFVPTLSDPVFFHGETSGRVSRSPPEFDENVQYPWLSPNNFNGWFIPDGCTKRLGEMEFEDSLKYDFRIKSLTSLIERINELNAALNLGPQYFSQRIELNTHVTDQKSFWSVEPNFLPSRIENIIVIGRKCAGKTTYGDYFHSKDNFFHIEASSVLRDLAARHSTSISTNEEAHEFLKKIGFSAVSQEVVKFCLGRSEEGDLNIISGFRTIEEVLFFFDHFPRTIIVYIDCDSRIRFERHIRRARNREPKSYREFMANDEQESNFGLLRIGETIADVVIANEGTIVEFGRKIDLFISRLPSYRREHLGDLNETARSLLALCSIGRRATCNEISNEVKKLGLTPVRTYNTNRALKEVPEFAKRHEPSSGKILRYSITELGTTFLTLLKVLGRLGNNVPVFLKAGRNNT